MPLSTDAAGAGTEVRQGVAEFGRGTKEESDEEGRTAVDEVDVGGVSGSGEENDNPGREEKSASKFSKGGCGCCAEEENGSCCCKFVIREETCLTLTLISQYKFWLAAAWNSNS